MANPSEIFNDSYDATNHALRTSGGNTVSNSAAVTSVAGNAASSTLLAANTSRVELIIQNDSSATLYIKFGTTASATDYTVKLSANDILTSSYKGRIDGIWSAATGAAKITELS